MPGCGGGHAGAAGEGLGLSTGHGPCRHLQLWPNPSHLPHRGQGLLQQGHQLRGEELCTAPCPSCQGGMRLYWQTLFQVPRPKALVQAKICLNNVSQIFTIILDSLMDKKIIDNG